jgi:endonuclease III
MAGSNRAALIAKIYKVLKQHYKPVSVNGDRPLLEQMLFACCLENAHYEKAEKTYEHLSTSFFDWNEVRVSSVKELSESLRDLPDPAAAASNLKRILQTVFEAAYSFDLEPMKKQNLGVGIKRLEKMEGASPFVVGYATQHGLGGHSIPLDRGALEILYIVGIATEAERDAASVAGLERAIPKNKGTEFASLLHQFSADFITNPFAPTIKTLLLSINPDAKDRLPKRGQKKESPKAAEVAAAALDGKTASGKANLKVAAERAVHDKTGRDARHHDKSAGKKDETKDSKKPLAGKVTGDAGHKKLSGKKELPAKPAAKASRPPAAAHARDSRSSARKSPAKHLAKRKPR